MKIPNKPRYEFATYKAHLFTEEHKINRFPVDPFKLAEMMDISLMTYSELSIDCGYSIQEIIRQFGSEDGFSIFQDGYYCVAYNDTINIDKRLSFTIIHELGHIYLNHFDFEKTTLLRNGLSKNEYKVLENEVNCFARNVLAPAPIVNNLDFKHPGIISNIFNISFQAAKARLGFLENDIYYSKKTLSYGKMEDMFYKFIYKMTHTYRCYDCGIKFLSDDPHCCKKCGGTNINKTLYFPGVDDQMIYKGFQMKNGRAIICPRCENEELHEDADNCKICNAPIINKCAETQINYNDFKPSCGAILDGNARYCKCGNESTFFQENLLPDWKTEKQEWEKNNK